MAAVAETASSGHEIDRSAAPLISVRNVWKIFGRNAGKIVGTPDESLSRSELRAKHDCVAAVRDVSFDVWTREIFVLFKLENMPQQDIANAFGISRSAVEKHVMKAMLHLGMKYGNT